jgi:hypothetical protein
MPERWLLSQRKPTAKVPKLPPAAPSPRATGAERELVAGGIAGGAVVATPLVADIDRENLCNGSEEGRLSEGNGGWSEKHPDINVSRNDR